MSHPRIDFYILNSNEPEDLWLVACRLLEKAYLRGHRIFVYCENEERAKYLDELLWTYKDDSFIPHNLQGEGPEPPPQVQIGFSAEPRNYNDILLNLNSKIPPYFSRFRRVIEIVGANDEAKNLSREHYREYRKNRCEIFTHDINLSVEAKV